MVNNITIEDKSMLRVNDLIHSERNGYRSHLIIEEDDEDDMQEENEDDDDDDDDSDGDDST